MLDILATTLMTASRVKGPNVIELPGDAPGKRRWFRPRRTITVDLDKL